VEPWKHLGNFYPIGEEQYWSPWNWDAVGRGEFSTSGLKEDFGNDVRAQRVQSDPAGISRRKNWDLWESVC